MFNLFNKKSFCSIGSEAEKWFGKPDIVQTMTDDIFFKEWIDVSENEILQIYYSLTTAFVSLKILPKTPNVQVNDLVPWSSEFTERQALDHLVQVYPRGFLAFHPDLNSLSFTNQDLY